MSITSSPQITIPDGKISDYIDGKLRNDTLEEYVRQTIEKRLVNELSYPRERIRVEYTLSVGSNKPRADIVVFPKDIDPSQFSQEKVSIIVECKKETIEPKSKKDGVEQLKSYMAVCSNCEWGLWTNGKHREVLRKVKLESGKIDFIEFNDIPGSDGSVEDIERPKRNKLKNAVEDNLLFVFKTCHNHIYANDGLEKQAAFFELLKMIFCKIEDERNFPQPLEFYTTSSERSNPDGQLVVKKRISKIFERVKKKYHAIFSANEEIDLKSRSLAWIVSELQGYSLLNTHIDIKGKAYEEIVGANLRGDKGQFFTPRNIMRMAVEMVNPRPDEKVLDSSCGTGGFLVTAMTHVIKQLEGVMEKESGRPKALWTDEEKVLLQSKISEIASNNYFGFDIAPELVKATKMNMVMNNDGSGHVYELNSLLPPPEWNLHYDGLADRLRKIVNEPDITFLNQGKISFVDIIFTNPPFGSKIPIKDSSVLSQFDLGYIWEKPKEKGAKWKRTERLQSSVPPEQLFVERCMQFLKPGGRMAIVLPDSILGNPALGYIRQWVVERAFIIGSIDLHADTFQPRNGTQTSILILQKKNKDDFDYELKKGHMRPYNVYMAIANRVGHDKRGNIIYKRNSQGDEILVPEEELDPLTGKIISKSLKRAIDDQTVDISSSFIKWKKKEGITW